MKEIKIYIELTKDFSFVIKLLEKINAFDYREYSIQDTNHRGIYLDNLDNDRWEYLTKRSVRDFNNYEKEKGEALYLTDIGFEQWIKKHRGELIMSNLNLL